jgi:Ca2+-binding EF-hand superfamily protein
MLRVSGLNPTQTHIQSLCQSLSLSGIFSRNHFYINVWLECIGLSEFERAWERMKTFDREHSSSEMKAALRTFDHDGVGQISISELRHGNKNCPYNFCFKLQVKC